jgi:hypothetical protein
MRSAMEQFDHIIIVVPLHDIFQDDSYGNGLEIHWAYITHHFFDRYKPVEKHIVREMSTRYERAHSHETDRRASAETLGTAGVSLFHADAAAGRLGETAGEPDQDDVVEALAMKADGD